MKKTNSENSNAQRQKEILDKIRSNNNEKSEFIKMSKKQTQMDELENTYNCEEEKCYEEKYEEELEEELEDRNKMKLSKKVGILTLVLLLIGFKLGWDYFIPDYFKLSFNIKVANISRIWNKEEQTGEVSYDTPVYDETSLYGGESTVVFVDSNKAKVFREFLISVGLYEEFNYNPTYDCASLMMYDLMNKHNPINGTEDKNIFIYFTAKDFYDYFNTQLFVQKNNKVPLLETEEGTFLEGVTDSVD